MPFNSPPAREVTFLRRAETLRASALDERGADEAGHAARSCNPGARRGPGPSVRFARRCLGVAAFILFDSSRERPRHRILAQAAAVLAMASVVLAYVSPLIIKGTWAGKRPSATARLQIVSPLPGEVFQGDPASVPIQLRLVGGRVVSATSASPLPNVGHIHVYLDGKLVSMSPSLSDRFDVGPGKHELEVDFVASDHGPFNPPVRAVLSFEVNS